MRVPNAGKRRGGDAAVAPPHAHAGYLRDTKSGVLRSRPVVLRESRDDIRVSWRRSAAIAMDLIQNSGRLRGAADQVIADTVGSGLTLNYQPDPAVMARLGYSPQELAEHIRMVKQRWKRWAWNPRECDLRGKLTVPQMIDIGLRWNMAFGEVTGRMVYVPRTERLRRGFNTGLKVCMVPPTRLVQDTSEWEGLFQGVYHDDIGRPVGYRFEERRGGVRTKEVWPAYDRFGRAVVLHVFDPVDATDVRGISVMAAAFRKHIQHEMLDDATLQTAILQTLMAITLTAQGPSAEVFEALEALSEGEGKGLGQQYLGMLQEQLEAAQESSLSIGGDPSVSHLAPGEKLEMHGAKTPGADYQPFSDALSRDMARAIGMTYGGLTMNYKNATYSSVRMENSSIWPVVVRRRERVAMPIEDAIFCQWLEEEVAEGRTPFKGGYAAFLANQEAVSWAQWNGPSKPTADDGKSAKASTERLQNGTSSVEVESAELGVDPDEIFDQRLALHRRYEDAGMVSPYAPRASAPAPANEKEPENEQ